MGLLIRDGFTLDGLLPARPGLHEELKFSYRPALPERVTEYLQADCSTKEKEMRNIVKFLAEHLSGWQEEAPITEANLRLVHHPDLIVMVNHVTGYSSTDWAGREKN